jgi:hypothetical protein
MATSLGVANPATLPDEECVAVCCGPIKGILAGDAATLAGCSATPGGESTDLVDALCGICGVDCELPSAGALDGAALLHNHSLL